MNNTGKQKATMPSFRFRISFLMFFAGLLMLSSACEEPWPITSCNNPDDVFDGTDVPVQGPENAPVDLTFFADFQCPYTHAFWRELSRYLDAIAETADAQRLSVRFRHYPLTSIHDRALPASLAAASAHQQGNEPFWTMMPFLMTRGTKLTDGDILYYAEAAGLDMQRFTADLESDETKALVARDFELGQSLGIPGTPTVYICGQRITGSAEDIIDNLRYLVEK